MQRTVITNPRGQQLSEPQPQPQPQSEAKEGKRTSPDDTTVEVYGSRYLLTQADMVKPLINPQEVNTRQVVTAQSAEPAITLPSMLEPADVATDELGRLADEAAALNTVIFPVPENFGGKSCYISSAMQCMTSLISQDDLDALQARTTVPAELTRNIECRGPLRDHVITAWLRLKDAFCDYQQRIRQAGNTIDLPEEVLVELIEAASVFGHLAGNSSVIDLFIPMCTEGLKPTAKGFLMANIKMLQQQDPEELMLEFINALSLYPNGECQWNSCLPEKNTSSTVVDHIGNHTILHNVTGQGAGGYCIEVPLSQDDGEDDGAKTMHELLTYRVLSSQDRDGRSVSQEDATAAYLKAQGASPLDRDLTQSISLALGKISSWDEQEKRDLYHRVSWQLPDRNDAFLMRLQVFDNVFAPQASSSDDQYLGLNEGMEGMEVVDFRDLVTPSTIPEKMHVKGASSGGKVVEVAVKRPNGILYRDSLFTDKKQADAYRLTHAFYDIYGFPVADLLPVTNSPGTKTHLLTPFMPGMKGGVYTEDSSKIVRAMENGAKYGAAVVFDAWLGNVGVANSRLAMEKEDGVNYVYRTEFHGLGYDREGKAALFGDSAVVDLNALLEEPGFRVLKEAPMENRLQTGMNKLRSITDEQIMSIVAAILPDTTEEDKETQAQIITKLIARRESLLAMSASITPSTSHADKLTPGARQGIPGKRHHEAVGAFCETQGQMVLPHVMKGDDMVLYKANAKSVICHIGTSKNSGHYISLNRIGDDWFVMDDMLTDFDEYRVGGVSLSDYLELKKREHLIDEGNRNGFQTLRQMLEDSSLQMTPYTILWEREQEDQQKRPEWRASVEEEKLDAWRHACSEEARLSEELFRVQLAQQDEQRRRLEQEEQQRLAAEQESARKAAESESFIEVDSGSDTETSDNAGLQPPARKKGRPGAGGMIYPRGTQSPFNRATLDASAFKTSKTGGKRNRPGAEVGCGRYL